ncbi:MAG: hypothetical protein WBE90_06120 [Xanthobacteraceae bacterium]
MIAKLVKRDAERVQTVKMIRWCREYLFVDVFRFAKAAVLVQLGGIGEQCRDQFRLPAPESGQACRLGLELIPRLWPRRNVSFLHHRPVSAETMLPRPRRHLANALKLLVDSQESRKLSASARASGSFTSPKLGALLLLCGCDLLCVAK